MITTCPVCRRSLGLADRNGRHVADEAHYPHRGASGAMICSPPAATERPIVAASVRDCAGERRPPRGRHLRLVRSSGRKVAPS